MPTSSPSIKKGDTLTLLKGDITALGLQRNPVNVNGERSSIRPGDTPWGFCYDALVWAAQGPALE